MKKWQITGETVGEVKAVADMHQRKAEMARNSDAFIALPGWFIQLVSPLASAAINQFINIMVKFNFKKHVKKCQFSLDVTA